MSFPGAQRYSTHDRKNLLQVVFEKGQFHYVSSFYFMNVSSTANIQCSYEEH